VTVWEISQEFKMISRLQHVSHFDACFIISLICNLADIVEAIDVVIGGSDQPPWLVMEWMPGDLTSVTLDDKDTPKLGHDISAGLDFMRSRGLAHRDLKPSNILVKLKHERL
jgi:serine/threonine protein kinase